MKSVAWGRGGGPARAAGGRLHPVTPAGNEVWKFVVEMQLMQGRRRGCLCVLVLLSSLRQRCGRTGASYPPCTLAFASSAPPAPQGAGSSSRSRREMVPCQDAVTPQIRSKHRATRGDHLRRHRRCQHLRCGMPAAGWGGSAPGHPSGIFLRHRARFFAMPKQILADY